jgi:hypothetical protein
MVILPTRSVYLLRLYIIAKLVTVENVLTVLWKYVYKYLNNLQVVKYEVWLITMGCWIADLVYWHLFKITGDTLNSFCTISVLRSFMKNLLLISDWSLLLPNLRMNSIFIPVTRPEYNLPCRTVNSPLLFCFHWNAFVNIHCRGNVFPVTEAERSKHILPSLARKPGSWVRIPHKAWIFGVCMRFSVFVLSCF